MTRDVMARLPRTVHDTPAHGVGYQASQAEMRQCATWQGPVGKGLPEGWVCGIPGLSRTVRLRILGNGVVPRQGAAALRLLIVTATGIPVSPQPSRPGGHHARAAA